MNGLRYEVGPPMAALPSLHPITVMSGALGRRADVSVVDHGAGQLGAVIVLLHGVGSSHWAWLHHGKLLDVAARRTSSTRVLFVMPSDGLWGYGSGYVNWSGGRHEDWVAEEVPEVVRAVWSESHSVPWFVTGLSMGGYGAIRLGVRSAHLFRACFGLSPVTSLADLSRFGSPSPADDRVVADLATSLLEAEVEPGRVNFSCGRDDPLIESNRALHRMLEARSVPHTYIEVAGGHSWSLWCDQLPRVVDQFLGVSSTGVATALRKG